MARLGGNFGAVYLGSSPVKVLDVYDWQWEASTEIRDASIKGDIIERFVASHGTGYRFTAKRRNQGTTVFPALVFDAAVNNTRTTWRLDLVDGSGSFVQISGIGFARTTSLNSPADAAVDETFELQFDENVVVSM